MDFSAILSKGFLEKILSSKLEENNYDVFVQIIEIKKLSKKKDEPVYAMKLSDGINSYDHCLTQTQMGKQIDQGEIPLFSVIQLLNFRLLSLHNRKVLYVLKVRLVYSTFCALIGSPQAIRRCKSTNEISPVIESKFQCLEGKVTFRTCLDEYSSNSQLYFFVQDVKEEVRVNVFGNKARELDSLIQSGYRIKINHLIVMTNQPSNKKKKEMLNLQITDKSTLQILIRESLCNIHSLSYLDKCEMNSLVHVVGVCILVQPITRNLNNEHVRLIQITDASKRQLSCTLVGQAAHTSGLNEKSVIGLYRVRLLRQGSVISSIMCDDGHVNVEPKCNHAKNLQQWINGLILFPPPLPLLCLRISIREIALFDRLQWRKSSFCLIGLILYVGKATIFRVCVTCRKKLFDYQNGYFYCDQCKEEVHLTKTGNRECMVNLILCDYSGLTEVALFSEHIDKLLDEKVSKSSLLLPSRQYDLKKLLQKLLFKSIEIRMSINLHSFRMKVFNRVKCLNADKINYKEYGNYLISKLTYNY